MLKDIYKYISRKVIVVTITRILISFRFQRKPCIGFTHVYIWFLILSDVLSVKFIITNMLRSCSHFYFTNYCKNNLTTLDYFKRTDPLNLKFLS